MDLEKKAKKLGATEFGISGTKTKRFYVIYAVFYYLSFL